MRERVYIETTVISYLAGRPTSDTKITEYQAATRRWWEERRQRYDLVTSGFVKEEAACGNEEFAAKRLGYLQGIRMLHPSPEETDRLGQRILDAGVIPQKASADAYHVAVCAIHSIDYLLTWNCKHLAKREIFDKVGKVLNRLGYLCPRMLTPKEMMKEEGNG